MEHSRNPRRHGRIDPLGTAARGQSPGGLWRAGGGVRCGLRANDDTSGAGHGAPREPRRSPDGAPTEKVTAATRGGASRPSIEEAPSAVLGGWGRRTAGRHHLPSPRARAVPTRKAREMRGFWEFPGQEPFQQCNARPRADCTHVQNARKTSIDVLDEVPFGCSHGQRLWKRRDSRARGACSG